MEGRLSGKEYRARPESLKNSLKVEYDNLLHTSINPDNVHTFYDEAVDTLILIVSKATSEYKEKNPGTTYIGKELEDAALGYLGLQSVTDTLDAISKRKESIYDLERNIARMTGVSKEVFVPPSKENNPIVPGSSKGLEEKNLIPRLTTLMYILQNDLHIYINDPAEDTTEDDIKIIKGETTDNMMRRYPYFRVEIPELNRVVYICEEEGNASFIFDRDKILQKVISIERLDTTDKDEYKKYIEEDPAIGSVLRQNSKWRERMLTYLTENFDVNDDKKPNVPKSDFEHIKEVPKKKEGWESSRSLRHIFKASGHTIISFAEKYRVSNPGWFERQKSGSVEAEHYHPDLVEKMVEHFNETPGKKDGWESAKSLIPIVKADLRKIKSFAERYRVSNPEWFEKQKSRGHEAEHYHPDLVKEIVEHFNETPGKKEGWESASGLMRVVKAAHRNIKFFAERYRVSNPEWFEIQKSGSQKAEHYHPDLVEKMVEHFNETPGKKDGWESAKSLRRAVKADGSTIISFAEKYRVSNPGWFEKQKSRGHEAEHYHPDLVEIIIKELGRKENKENL